MWWASAALVAAVAALVLLALAARHLRYAGMRLRRCDRALAREAALRREAAAIQAWPAPINQSARVVTTAVSTGARLTKSGGRIARRIYRAVTEVASPEQGASSGSAFEQPKQVADEVASPAPAGQEHRREGPHQA